MLKHGKLMIAFAMLGLSVTALTGCEAFFTKLGQNDIGGDGNDAASIFKNATKITSIDQIPLLAEGGIFTLENDIDFENQNMHSFTLKKDLYLDGKGHCFKNLNIYNLEDRVNAGFFNWAEDDVNNFVLQNFEMKDVNVYHECKSPTASLYVGLLLGSKFDFQNKGRISNCKFTGSVNVNGRKANSVNMGGLSGAGLGNCTIENTIVDVDLNLIPSPKKNTMCGFIPNPDGNNNVIKNTIVRGSFNIDSSYSVPEHNIMLYGFSNNVANDITLENVLVSTRKVSLTNISSDYNSHVKLTGAIDDNELTNIYYANYKPGEDETIDPSEYINFENISLNFLEYGRGLPYKNSEIFTKEFLTHEHSDVKDPVRGDNYPVFLSFDLTNWNLHQNDSEGKFIAPSLKVFDKEAQ